MKLLEFLDIIREDDSSEPGKFVGARLTRDSERKLLRWMRDVGLRKREPRARLHVTIIGDKQKDFDWTPAEFDPPLEIDPNTYQLKRFGQKHVVLTFSSPELEQRHEKAKKEKGIHWEHEFYQPHITLSKDPKELNNIDDLLMPTFPIYIDREYEQPFDFDYGSDRRRKKRTDESFLFERNLMNAPWAKEVAQQYVTDTFYSQGGFPDLPHLGEWAEKALAKYLINDYPAVIRVNSFQPVSTDHEDDLTGHASVTYPRVPQFGMLAGTREQDIAVPQWVPNALERGDEIYFLDNRGVQGTGGLPQQMNIVRDWLRNLARNADPFVMQKGRINRVSWAQAVQKAEEWHDQMQAGESDIEELPEHKELFLDLGEAGQWWKLTGETCVSREGELMGHCVGDYIDDVESGYSVIISLRDKKNLPHVTVELRPTISDGPVIEQVKGKENEPPVEKYWKQVDELLKKLNEEYNGKIQAAEMGVDDLEGCGILAIGNMFVRTNKNLNEAEAWMRANLYPEYVDGYEDMEEQEIEMKDSLDNIMHELSQGQFHVIPDSEDNDEVSQWFKWTLIQHGYWETESETTMPNPHFNRDEHDELDPNDPDPWIDGVPVSITVGLPGIEHEVLTGDPEKFNPAIWRGWN